MCTLLLLLQTSHAILVSNTYTYESKTISAFYRWAVREIEDARDVDVLGQALNEYHHVQLDEIRRQILAINDTLVTHFKEFIYQSETWKGDSFVVLYK